VIEGIEFEDQASGVVEVYLNAPGVEKGGRPEKGHAVGTFSFFTGHAAAPPNRVHANAPGGHGGAAPRFSRVFDINETVRALQAIRKWSNDEVQVSLVRRPFDRETPVKGRVSFSRAELHMTTP
jgi:hypothetical protein